MKKRTTQLLICLIISTVTVVCLVVIMLHRSSLSVALVNALCKHYVSDNAMQADDAGGSLWDTVHFKELELHDIKGLPATALVKIQSLDIGLHGFRTNDILINIENGRLFLPYSDVIRVQGALDGGQYDVSVYAPSLSVYEIVRLIFPEHTIQDIAGDVSSFDMQVSGDLFAPQVTGSFILDTLNYKNIALKNAHVDVALSIDRITPLHMTGLVTINDGLVHIKNNTLSVQKSTIECNGDPRDPIYHLSGTTTVEGVKIILEIHGTRKHPELKITSNPSYSQTRLLLMLITGKTWEKTEASLKNKEITSEVAADFFDYFIFGGTGDILQKRFGIDKVALTFNTSSKGVYLEKKVIDNVQIGYGIEQKKNVENVNTVAQKIGTRVQLTDAISVEADKTVTSKKTTDGKTNGEEKAMVTYKKKF